MYLEGETLSLKLTISSWTMVVARIKLAIIFSLVLKFGSKRGQTSSADMLILMGSFGSSNPWLVVMPAGAFSKKLAPK